MKETYSQKAEIFLRELGKKIDDLIEKSKESTGELGVEIEKRIEELKRSRDKFEEDIQNFTSNKDGKWSQVEIQLKKAAEELKKAFDLVIKKAEKGK